MYNVLDKNSRVAQLWLAAINMWKFLLVLCHCYRVRNKIPTLLSFIIDFCNTAELSPCGHLAIMDTPIKRIAARSQAKINYRRSTEINSSYYGHSLMRTPTRGPTVSSIKGVDCIIDRMFLRWTILVVDQFKLLLVKTMSWAGHY